MEQSIWIIILIIISIITFAVILGIITLARESGIRSLSDLFNLSKFLEIVGIKK